MNTLSGNFRQFSLWGTAKSRLGPMKKPGAVRLEQAPSAVSRLFRDCFAILGLLRRPPPDSLGLITKHGCSPRDRNDVGLPTSMLRQQHSRISKSDRIELARFRSSFVLRRISGARSPKPYPINWRKHLTSTPQATSPAKSLCTAFFRKRVTSSPRHSAMGTASGSMGHT